MVVCLLQNVDLGWDVEAAATKWALPPGLGQGLQAAGHLKCALAFQQHVSDQDMMVTPLDR